MRIQSKIFIGSLAALTVLTGALLFPLKALAVTNQSIAVPLFEKPNLNSFWSDVRSAGRSSVPFVVANPNNGPGLTVDPAYAGAIAQNSAANVRTLGYIQTNFQTRNFKEAYGDIDAWYRLYPQTSGIYVDLIKEGGQDEACYVAALYNHVKNVRPNDLVIVSPGTHISPTYEPYGDIFVNAAMDYDTYKSWTVQYRGFEDKPQYQNRFWHIIHGISSDEYSSAFADIRSNNAGWMYMTDKLAPTPYNATPSFWQNEAAEVGALPESSIPNRGKTSLPRGCISLSSSAENTVDTRTAKQSTTSSIVRVNNVDKGYDSEPLTSIKFVGLPAGTTVTSIRGDGWACDGTAKSCSYSNVIPAASSTPTISTVLTAGCDYAGGDATLRLTNFAGNRWDLKIPVRPPFGCDPSSGAGKLNSDTSGQVITLTTQSIETTPDIAPLGGTSADTVTDQPKQAAKKGMSAGKIALIILAILVVAGLAGWGIWFMHQRNKYKVTL